jgi:hypothetical protein
VSSNDPNFVQIVQEWFDEEDLSCVDAELNCNEPISTSNHDKNTELSETDKSEVYNRKSSSTNEDNQIRKAFYGKQVGSRRI